MHVGKIMRYTNDFYTPWQNTIVIVIEVGEELYLRERYPGDYTHHFVHHPKNVVKEP